MATENQGIMSLPQAGQEAAAPQMSMDDAYDAVQGGLQDASPQASMDMQGLLAQITPMLDQLTDEQLDSLLQLFQYLIDHPEEYKQRVQELISDGTLEEGMLPEEYDPEVLSAIAVVLLHARRQRQPGNEREMAAQVPQPPAELARGGIAEAARMVASKGRTGDTMLAHINKKEAAMLKKHGGMGTLNPSTGLPEYGFFKSLGKLLSPITAVVKSVVNVVKQVVKSPVGKILATAALATFLGPGAFGVTGLGLGAGASAALASGAVTALGGGNIKDVLRSAATAYLGAPGGPVSTYLGNAGAALGVTNAAGQAAINAGLTGAGVGLLTGQKLADAVKSGLVAGAIQGGITGAQQGFGAQAPTAKVDLSTPATSDNPALKMPGQAGAATAPAAMPTPAELINEQIYGKGTVSPSAPPMAASGAPSQAALDQIYEGAGPAQTAARAAAPGAAPAAADTGIFSKVKGLYDEYLSPTGIRERGAQDALAAVQKQFPGTTAEQVANAPAGSALAKAYSAALPGTISTYGPLVGAGLGIAALTGGFSAKQPQPSALAQQLRGTPGEDLIKANPRQYLTQNLPGVRYDETGNIVGSQPWNPNVPMESIRVATPGIMPPVANTYQPPPMTIGGGMPVAQPYNNPYMYGSLAPMQRAYGGIASLAEGGYPRRTGQISGPGTETSDSIPAMLSDGEFVMTAKAVRAAGKGDRRAGAKKMYALMHQLERNASRG